MARKDKKGRGRPTTYSAALAEKICKALIEHKSLKKACAKNKNFPNEDTIYTWRFDSKHTEFSEMYTRARMCVIEKYLDDGFEIAGAKPLMRQIVSVTGGTKNEPQVTTTEIERVDTGAVQANRNLVDFIKWAACKVIPKTYGDKLQVDAGPGLEELILKAHQAGEERRKGK